MKKNNSFNIKSKFTLTLTLLFLTYLFVQTGCDKNKEPDYNSDFSYEFVDDNHVQFTNESTGEYYFLTWDFGNGVTDTITDKKQTYTIYYPQAGDYEVSLRLTNYYGSNKTTKKTVKVASDDLDITVSFTAEIDHLNPNYVNLVNTTVGNYDSFKWLYRDLEVENQTEYPAYFPFAGDYEIELVVMRGSEELSEEQMVTIAQDDPDYDPNLIWADEFDYTGFPDPSFWNIEVTGEPNNNELQYYTDSENNVHVENGVLRITAIEESFGGKDYTSARITTQNKFDFKYGRIEARIKLPYGQGIWPAFWMLGADINSIGWPACGEIDIMEMVGGTNRDNTVYSTLHWESDGSHAEYGKSYTLSSGIFADDFHIFSVKWDSQSIKGLVDGIEYFVIDITDAQLSEFHEDFFVLLNLAVGGNWPGDPDATTTFPQTMEVDYVRFYQD